MFSLPSLGHLAADSSVRCFLLLCFAARQQLVKSFFHVSPGGSALALLPSLHSFYFSYLLSCSTAASIWHGINAQCYLCIPFFPLLS